MTTYYERERNRQRLNAYYRKLVRRPDYSYLRLLAAIGKGQAIKRRWRELFAERETRQQLQRVLGGGV